MKQFKISFLLFVLMSMLSNKASAHNAEINGIYYNFSGDEATVTYKGNSYTSYPERYSGSIVIPKTVNYNDHTYTVTSIGTYAFHGCESLTSVEIPNSVTSINYRAFAACHGLASIEIPNSITIIERSAFDCSGLTSIEIPNSVTVIDRFAFNGCTSLTSIKIPSSVTTIVMNAFSGCTNLTSVKVEWETPISIGSEFSSRTNATLYVPAGCKAVYETHSDWKDFKEIVEYTEMAMGFNGIATYSSNVDLDFTSLTGLKAYIASGFRPSTGTLILSRVYRVPAGEGLMLKGDPGSYDIPSVPVDEIYANLLVGVPTATTVNPTDGSYTNFILANDEVKGIGFYPLASAGEIGSNKAYLQLPTSALPAAAARRINLIFDDEEDEPTGISASLNDKGALDPRSLATNGTQEMKNDKPVYDLQGRRVEKPTRGLYIKEGKKIMVK